jgi:prevent-host-death family protein
METTTIADAKNNLPKLVHAAEAGEDIQLTRHGRAAAVLVSQAPYMQLFGTGKAVFQEMTRWRENHMDVEITDQEVDSWRDRSPVRDFSWD